ncbi:MAG: hypothetical protein ACP5RM_00735 [Candidatus Micrarchaeia archaeon]
MLVVMLAFVSVAHSQEITSCSNLSSSSLGSFILGAIPLSFIGIMLSFLLIAITFMIGEVLNYGPLKGWYKTELWEVSKSILVIVIVFSSMIVGSAIVAAFVGTSATYQAGSTPSAQMSNLVGNLQGLCTAATNKYLAPQLINSTEDFSFLLGVSQGIGALKSTVVETWFSLPIPLIAPVIFLQFGSIANIYVSSYLSTISPTTVFSFIKDLMTMIIFPMLFIFRYQYDLLPTIIATGIGVFIPIGIVLRALPFARGIGGTFIAIGIGASLVYPALLVGFNLPLTNFINSAVPQPLSFLQNPSYGCPSGASGLWCTVQNYIFIFVDNFIGISMGGIMLDFLLGASAVGISQGIGAYGAGSLVGFSTPVLYSSILPILNIVIDQTLLLVVQFLLFVFDLIIGLALVNAIARSLGGTTSLQNMGVGKMKLA